MQSCDRFEKRVPLLKAEVSSLINPAECLSIKPLKSMDFLFFNKINMKSARRRLR